MNIKILIVFALFLKLFPANGQIILPPVIDNNMVLQQETNVWLWGKTSPGATVKIVTGWNKQKYNAVAGTDSIWKVKVSTPKASFTAYTISFSSKQSKIEKSNILIGEVWLCGGQSNMEMPMKGFSNQPVNNSLVDITNSTDAYLRYFTVKRNRSVQKKFSPESFWGISNPNTTSDFSATAYYFGRLMRKVLNVPVALLHCSFGGTAIEAWIPVAGFSDFPNIVIPKAENDVKSNSSPTVLYNGMMHSIAGYGIRGAIWYQGEANRARYKEYPALFAAMHKEWEKEWGIGEFPVYLCQIAPFDYTPRGEKSNLAFMREAQVKIGQTQKNTGTAILLDAGEQNIIHPANKVVAGERLAYLAMGKTYGMDKIYYQSPEYKSFTVKNDTVVISFDKVSNGLSTFGSELTGFEIAGADKIFYPASKAVINKNTVEVLSAKVAVPVAVRYCFKSFVTGVLKGCNGLPISSFRTDNWDDVQ